MYRYLSDATNLKAVFGSYTTLEALQVKHHIELVVKQLKIPSRALLEHMQQEGISLSDLQQSPEREAEWATMSEAVIRSHLRATFIDDKKLHAALSALNLPQQVEVRDLLQVVTSYLRVPSDTLLRRMKEEGLTLDKLGVKTTEQSHIGDIRSKLTALNQQYAAKPQAIDESLSSLKQRIRELTAEPAIHPSTQPVATDLPAADVPEVQNVIKLARLQEKFKAQG